MKKMSTNNFTEAIKQAKKDSQVNYNRISSSQRVKRITRHIRVGEKTYGVLKSIAQDTNTTISKTADNIFSEINPQSSK